MRLGINTGFAVNRYPLPSQWLKVIGQDLDLRYVQVTADLINPDLDEKIINYYITEINSFKCVYNVTVDSVMTGAFTRVNHLSHPAAIVRDYWKRWFKKLIDISVDIGANNVASHFGILSYDDLHNEHRHKFILEETVDAWKELAEYGKSKGLKYLGWEPMSIAREYGETIDATRKLVELFKDSAIPFHLCLDVDHGDITSLNKDDTDYRKWIETFASISPLIHLKQSLEDKGGHYPFIEEYNQKGKVKPAEFVETLKKSNALEDILILLELSFKEREPVDENVLNYLKESVDYWRDWIK